MKLRVNPKVGLLAVALAASLTWVHAQQRGGATVAIDGDDIGGVVASAKGPEAGVPYPLGFHSRHTSGRIDDPNAGWKGRGFWSSYSMYSPWHQEGGKGTRPKVVKFQARPNPLAK